MALRRLLKTPMTEPHLLRRSGVLAVHSINRFVLSVPDLDVAERFYSAFGLDVRRVDGRLDLLTFGNPHCWGSVYAGGQTKRLEYLSFGVDEADLPAWRDKVAASGAASAPHPLSDGSGLWLTNPDGTPLQLRVAPKVSPSQRLAHAERPVVAPGHGAAPARSRVTQVKPKQLSHLLFFTPDVPRMLAFCRDVLGLQIGRAHV